MGDEPLLLAINVGNTNVALGLFEGVSLLRCARFPAERHGTALDVFRRLRWPRPGAIVVGSVNPPVTLGIVRAAKKRWGIRVVEIGRRLPVPIRVRCRFPGRVGVDRLLNAVAARSLAAGAVIVVDFGTAITVNAVSSRGDFLGGAILPGVRTAAEALREKTAKLPLVRPARPRAAIGRHTEEAIRSGLYWGTCGAVERIVREFRKRLGDPKSPVIATGGDAELFARDLPPPSRTVPHLTLAGMAMTWAGRRAGGSRRR